MIRNRFVVGAVLVLAHSLSPAAAQGDRFFVVGHVRAPGAYTLPSAGAPTVEDGIRLAGGPTERGNLDDVIVIRRTDGKTTRASAKLSDLLLPNDTLQVGPPRAAQAAAGASPAQGAAVFYVIGWIGMPGEYTHAEGLTVGAAIDRAGGVKRKGDEELTIVVRRQSNGQSESIPVTLEDSIRPNDVVYISPRK